MAKTLDEFLDEQITEKLENAALSGCRVKDRPGKIRIRPCREHGREGPQAGKV